jgi:hypothetical protein
VCDRPTNPICRYQSQAQRRKHYSPCICIYFTLEFDKIPQRLFNPLLYGGLLLSLWLSAIMSKVTRFTTIKTIHILVFLTVAFFTLAFMSTIICFYSSLGIFGTLSLTFFIFRAICSTLGC